MNKFWNEWAESLNAGDNYMEVIKAKADAGDPKAMGYLGVCYAEGLEDLPEDSETAIAWLQKSAEAGESAAQYALHRAYFGTLDLGKAKEWLCRAAENGSSEAQFDLGQYYSHGDFGFDKDWNQALSWWQKAAEGGDEVAQYNIGMAFWKGDGVEQNDEQAAFWFRKSAEQNYFSAYERTAWCYAKGRGVEKNSAEARRWLIQWAEEGSLDAILALAHFYLSDNDQSAENDALVVAWLRKAVDQGKADAAYLLANCYAEGRGIEKDYAEARRLWNLAAEGGSQSAMLKLAMCYLNGDDETEKDGEKALKFFNQIIEDSPRERLDITAEAQYQIAQCYENGIGTDEDEDIAIFYYNIGAYLGSEKAIQRLRELGFEPGEPGDDEYYYGEGSDERKRLDRIFGRINLGKLDVEESEESDELDESFDLSNFDDLDKSEEKL